MGMKMFDADQSTQMYLLLVNLATNSRLLRAVEVTIFYVTLTLNLYKRFYGVICSFGER